MRASRVTQCNARDPVVVALVTHVTWLCSLFRRFRCFVKGKREKTITSSWRCNAGIIARAGCANEACESKNGQNGGHRVQSGPQWVEPSGCTTRRAVTRTFEMHAQTGLTGTPEIDPLFSNDLLLYNYTFIHLYAEPLFLILNTHKHCIKHALYTKCIDLPLSDYFFVMFPCRVAVYMQSCHFNAHSTKVVICEVVICGHAKSLFAFKIVQKNCYVSLPYESQECNFVSRTSPMLIKPAP